MPSDREPDYSDEALEALGKLDEADQAEVKRIIRNLCEDPWIDPPLKSLFLYPPVQGILYSDERFRVFYYFKGNTVLAIGMLGPVSDSPPESTGQGPGSWRA